MKVMYGVDVVMFCYVVWLFRNVKELKLVFGMKCLLMW